MYRDEIWQLRDIIAFLCLLRSNTNVENAICIAFENVVGWLFRTKGWWLIAPIPPKSSIITKVYESFAEWYSN